MYSPNTISRPISPREEALLECLLTPEMATYYLKKHQISSFYEFIVLPYDKDTDKIKFHTFRILNNDNGTSTYELLTREFEDGNEAGDTISVTLYHNELGFLNEIGFWKYNDTKINVYPNKFTLIE